MKRLFGMLAVFAAVLSMLLGSACADLAQILSHGIVVTDLTISPNPAEVGQTVTVTATVTNEGDEEGVFYTPLLIEGEAADVETVTLAAGASETVTFSAVMNFGGTYDIAIGDQEVTLTVTASEMQNILKMVPADWNAFLYFGAKTMRSDTATVPDKGLADLWAIADNYLEFFADQIELNTLAYPDGDLPFTLEQLDYLAFGIGGLETTDFSVEGSMPNMTLIVGGTFTTAQVSLFLNNFQTNWFDPGEGVDFVDGTYNGVDTWTVDMLDPEEEDPGVTVAVTEGSTVLLIGPTADVEDCIDVIQTAGDDDSMFENDNIRGVIGDFGNPVLMAVIDGNVPLPSGEEGGDGPTLPDDVAVTAGIAMQKTGDTMRLQAILEIGEMGDWLALLTDAVPTPQEMMDNQEARRLEEERQDEYWNLQEAVYYLMGDNWLPEGELPHPVDFAGGTATNNMSMFPDILSAAGVMDEKEWDHNGDPYTVNDKDGYLLWGHDGMANDSAVDPEGLWYYVDGDMVTTEYFYTCEADGTLRQWSAADLAAPGTEELTPDRPYWAPEGEPEE